MNLDINDNAPIFVNTPYEATVPEVGQWHSPQQPVTNFTNKFLTLHNAERSVSTSQSFHKIGHKKCSMRIIFFNDHNFTNCFNEIEIKLKIFLIC